MDFIIWGDLKKLLPPDDYETVWQSVFTSVAKFVLSIFDMVKSSSMSGLARSFGYYFLATLFIPRFLFSLQWN